MQIQMDSIPSSRRRPGVAAEFNTRLANQGLSANKQPVVILAPKLAAGTKTAGVPVEIFSDGDANAFAGRGSIAANMATHAFKTNSAITLSVVLVNDPEGGGVATGALTYSGSAGASGTVQVWVAETMVEVAVSKAATAAYIATAVAAAINGKLDLPVTATVNADNAAVVTLTFRHKGAIGNSLKVNAKSATIGIAVAVAPMSGGTLAHDVNPALTGVFTSGHKIILSAFSDSATLALLKAHCDNVSGSVEMRGVRAWCASTGSMGAASTIAAGCNSWLIHHALIRYLNTTGATAAPWAVAAAFGAVDASEEDPAMPLNTLPLPTLPMPDDPDLFGNTEVESLLYVGVTPTVKGPGGVVQVSRAITTHTTDASGAPSAALLDITTPKTLFYFREQVVNDQRIRFGRAKFSQRVAKAVAQRAVEIARRLEDLEILQNIDAHKAEFVWVADAQNANMMRLKLPSPIVQGLHIIADRFDLLLESPTA